MLRFLALIILSSTLAGCGLLQRGGVDYDTTAQGSAEEIFARAEALRGFGRYDDAAELYTEVERQFPLDPLAVRAQYERAKTLYDAQDYDDAIRAFDRFLGFNPGHPLEAEASLTKALCYYEQIPDVHRDQGVTVQARTVMLDLVQRFPESSEATNARGKLLLIEDQLAGHELVIGRSYQREGRFLAAQNRFKTVINDHPTTGQVPEAFFRLVETSLSLGLLGEARGYGATLGHNYPSSDWYRRAYDLLTRN